MATSSWRLGATCIVASAAYALMVAWAAVVYERNFLLDVAFLLPSAIAYGLAGLLVRRRPMASTVVLVAVAVLSGVSVLGYLAGDSMSSVAVWVLQWAAGLVAIITAMVVRLAGKQPSSDAGREAPGRQSGGVLGFTLVGLFAGAALGFALYYLIFTIEVQNGSWVVVSVLGLTVFQSSMVFGELVPITVSALLCAVLGIAGAFIGSGVAKLHAGKRGIVDSQGRTNG